jgi:GNAT superfamily N-acetyltransferase
MESDLNTLEIRDARVEDYAVIEALHNNDNEPHFHRTAEKLRLSDAKNTSGWRTVATRDGVVVGTTAAWLWSEVQAYRISVHSPLQAASLELIHDLERRAIGAKRLLATVRGDFLEHAHYLQHRFLEVFRSFGANLELEDFDSEKFAGLEASLLKKHIRILPRTEWSGSDAHLGQIQTEAIADLPSYEPVIPASMDFANRTLREPFWVAVREDEALGFCSLDGRIDKPVIYFDATGVSRSERQQGIGLALAARAVTWAKTKGFSEVNDGGAKTNVAHTRILERLGFELEPDWVTFEKFLM